MIHSNSTGLGGLTRLICMIKKTLSFVFVCDLLHHQRYFKFNLTFCIFTLIFWI
jgi:hypothetical protein